MYITMHIRNVIAIKVHFGQYANIRTYRKWGISGITTVLISHTWNYWQVKYLRIYTTTLQYLKLTV